MNLISTGSSDREILEKHFIDSLTLLPLLNDRKTAEMTLLDVGSGAGFPGLVVQTALPDLSVTLLEPRQKRVSFLRHVIRTVKMDKAEVIDARLDSDVPDVLADRQFDIITSRAVTDTVSFVGMAAPLLAPGGRIICMKGPGGEKEAQQFEEKQHSFSLRHLDTTRLRLPFSGSERQLLLFG